MSRLKLIRYINTASFVGIAFSVIFRIIFRGDLSPEIDDFSIYLLGIFVISAVVTDIYIRRLNIRK